MSPRKKAATVVFPPESCGACRFCVVDDGQYFCCAMPPAFAGQDENGYSLADRFLPVDLNDPIYIHFKQRMNA